MVSISEQMARPPAPAAQSTAQAGPAVRQNTFGQGPGPQFRFSQGVWAHEGSSTSGKKNRPPRAQQSSSGSGTGKGGSTKVKVDSLADIEAALKELEMGSTNHEVCGCMATRHPLLEIAPNCLNCGRIICTKEGLGPCCFCGSPLISNEELLEINRVLQLEKEQLTAGMSKKALRQAGIDPGKALSDMGLKPNKNEKSLEDAQRRLNTLLEFQESSAQRTKIIDQVSDFETPFQGVNKWASPIEQAQQLKRQQHQLRKMHEQQLQRSGRGKKVISIDLKGNKVYMTESAEPLESEGEEDELSEGVSTEAQTNSTSDKDKKKPLNSWNPNSYGKSFIKPVYRPVAGSGKRQPNSILKKIGIDEITGSHSRLNAEDDETRVLEM
ncbi:hypothetical protein AWJ20_4682 [Sugiyamaella lignohabitans]|uniref:TRIP4/RQT4 C2HC5-type zinc finger domain-containing protein n=1 Tax=Sugiyamaella lignohabitans TaxID=796027 RepID=A0A167E7J4_9ASCO|nr:uncharacterized protein AWJ20_4682 [Sugiyamaella lignohabitans]ANB13738.1 hypothetical protein AWJ20_4682 [Sugiyamaella lignohabitans]